MMSPFFKKLLSFLFIGGGLFLFAQTGLAQETDTLGMSFGEGIGLGSEDPRVMVANIIRIFLAFLGILAVGLMVYAGFIWMTSEGNAEKVDKAKKILTSAIIGLLIVLSAFAIASFIISQLLDATQGTGGDGGGGGSGGGGGIGGGGGNSCDGNTLTDVCEADNNLCADDEYCDDDSCTCQSLGGLGDSCDGNPETDECDADNDMCKEYLECQPDADCTCQGAPVIHSVTPIGGFCQDDPDTFCESDDDCPDSSCDTTTPNGAPGNLVTISGEFFGTTTGQVHFTDGGGYDAEASLASGANPECDDNWNEEQIIVVVPDDASEGPIRVTRNDDETDTTDNDRGDDIPDFVVNDIERPGLCKLDPTNGIAEDTISYYGLNLDGSTAYFGDYSSNKQAQDSSFLSSLEGEADVPLISQGDVTTFVKNDSRPSNFLDFTKNEESEGGPAINYFEPIEGPPGQYVTIYGQGFGSSQAGQTVYFGDEVTGVEADFDFPEVCGDGVWTDDQVIVKVPEDIDNGEYVITMELNSEVINSQGVVSTADRSPTFEVDDSLPLAPGLCKMEPVMGQVTTPVSLWGEYFGEDKDTVRFYPDIAQTGDNITYWGEDEDAMRADTSVPEEAASGPVKVVKDDQDSNGMEFEVGNCNEAENPDSACGSQICCPSGTYKADRCADDYSDCSVDIPTSVYEWEFDAGGGGGPGDPCYIDASSTPDCNQANGPCGDGLVCDPESCECEYEDSPYNNCEQRSQAEGNCDPVVCPNSPGQCSPYDAGSCDPDCSELSECDSGECEYNENLDNCVVSGSSCDLSSTTEETLDGETQTFTQYCDTYNDTTYWHLDTSQSCPDGWTNIGDGSCINEDSAGNCDICDTGECKDTEDGAVCAIDQNMCGGWEESVCECCCRIEEGEKDCCSFQVPDGYTAPEGFSLGSDGYLSLICDGDCGSDATGEDTDTYGSCSGCRIEDEDGNVDQELSDQACVCDDTSGKYCDVDADPDNDGEPEGVCRDCAGLNIDGCSDHHSTCCVDAMDDGVCRGGEGEFDLTNAPESDVAYCGYHQCTDSGDSCDSDNNPVASTSNEFYASSTVCTAECVPGPQLGQTCAQTSTNTDTCDTEICPDPFGCLNDDGSGPAWPDNCGVCCCTPGEGDCSTLGAGLNCQSDKGNCTGDDRGLCCGCEADTDCSNGDPTEVGCGSDTCCHARPSVDSTVPADGDSEVCANASISAEFDRRMRISSFSGNMIVAGEYDGQCPDGTEYVAGIGENQEALLAQNSLPENKILAFFYQINNKIHGFFHKTGSYLATFLQGDNALADMPEEGKNYCAVEGAVSGSHTTSGETEITFSQTELLDTDRKYFVIIKGDEDLDGSGGVLSEWGVGMNGKDNPAMNGATYENTYTWSFTTLSDQGNNGACAIDSVDMDPSSYLFQTTENDNNENDDNSNDDSFDTVSDRDKVFTAEPLSEDGAVLTPVSGYSWDWDWSIDNSAVVDIDSDPFDADNNKQLIQAQSGATDAETKVRAEVDLVEKDYTEEGDGEQGVSDVWVFLCANPWPPVADDGTWSPWADEENNCTAGDGNYCPDMHFETYYCRDQGDETTVDDLPAITVDGKIRYCDIPSSDEPCQDVLDDGGELLKNTILKEIFFFREEVPSAEDLEFSSVTTPSSGGEVELNWDWNGVEEVDHYKVYYDTSSGLPYDYSAETENESLTIEGLTNGQTYYFTVTAVYESGAESDYAEEESVTLQDEQGPEAPSINNTSAGDGSIAVNWSDQSEADAVSFKVYYTASDSCSPDLDFGGFITEPYSETATTTISGLSSGVSYCVGMTAMDEYGNSSATTTTDSSIAPE